MDKGINGCLKNYTVVQTAVYIVLTAKYYSIFMKCSPTPTLQGNTREPDEAELVLQTPDLFVSHHQIQPVLD